MDNAYFQSKYLGVRWGKSLLHRSNLGNNSTAYVVTSNLNSTIIQDATAHRKFNKRGTMGGGLGNRGSSHNPWKSHLQPTLKWNISPSLLLFLYQKKSSIVKKKAAEIPIQSYKLFIYTFYTAKAKQTNSPSSRGPMSARCYTAEMCRSTLFTMSLFYWACFPRRDRKLCMYLCRNKCFCKINRHNGRVQQQRLSECAKRALKPHQEGVKERKKLMWQKSRQTMKKSFWETKTG